MEIPDRDERDDEAGTLFALLFLMLRLELVGLLGDPPDAANVPEEFWQRVRNETESTLSLVLLGAFIASARHHGASIEQIRAEAVRWATAQAANAAESIAETSRERIDSIPANEITERAETVFGDSRAELVAVTAVTQAQTAGGEFASDRNSGDVWIAVGDERTCPTCGGLDGTTRDEWGESYENGPPAHPICRCFISYAAVPTNA